MTDEFSFSTFFPSTGFELEDGIFEDYSNFGAGGKVFISIDPPS